MEVSFQNLSDDSAQADVEKKIEKTVKLVIWDLDDTFWQGTLSEEAIVPNFHNVELVKTLAARGIISSICSKNESQAVEEQLRKLDVWDYFVLPSISFQPKGINIASIISALQLRAENVVFIDDNPSVLAEAAFHCPGLVCLDNPALLAAQMNSPVLQGKADEQLSRLKQYQQLAQKFESRKNAGVNDEDFLRQSEIKVNIDFAVEEYMDRILELINRSNQLNYTKIRVETEEQKEHFEYMLKSFGFMAGVVKVSDKYADYGVVGFFLRRAFLSEHRLEHFVFSCRIMNMGVEQYVYDYLNRPDVEVQGDVANPIMSFDKVDWITEVSKDEALFKLRDLQLVLIGGCDLLQVSTYCSCHSSEFTNRTQNGIMKRLDDPFFILGHPGRVRASELRPRIPACTADEMDQLNSALKTADAIIVSFYRMMEPNYFKGADNLPFRLDQDSLTEILAGEDAIWFVRNFTFANYSHDELNDLIAMSFDRLAVSTKRDAKIVVLLEDTRKLEDNPEEFALKNLYNEFVIKQCARIEKLRFLDVNRAVDKKWLFDDGFHLARQGYHQLSKAIMKVIDS
ncbi:MAG TPA: hypothetical protein V6C76_03260 [Drouetiella sp.]